MRRSAKPRRVGFKAWLFGIILIGGALVAFFSFTDRAHQLVDWPLGISSEELEGYSGLLDRRPVETGGTRAVIYNFGGSAGRDACLLEQRDAKWRTRWFDAEGYGDSVDVRHLLDRAGYEIRFKKAAPFNGLRRMVLVPASANDMRSKYLEMIAGELGLIAPELSFVRLIGCGKELGVFRKEERLDTDLLARRGITDAALITIGLDPTRPDRQFAKLDADSAGRVLLRGKLEQVMAQVEEGNTNGLARWVDEKAAIAWLAMAWIDGRDLAKEPMVLAHQWTTGRLVPLYAPSVHGLADTRRSKPPIAYNPLTPMLRRPEFRARFEKRMAELGTVLPELRERFDAMNKAWLPVIVGTHEIALATAQVERVEEDLLGARITDSNAATLLDRPLLWGPGHSTFMQGMSIPMTEVVELDEDSAVLPWVKRYKLQVQGDSIIFPRGKYMIDEDLVFPAGRTVVMLQGARLFLGAGNNLVCKGDLLVRGTLRNPVFIRPQEDGAPYGTIAVLGTGSQQVEIAGLYISGGKGATVNGVRHAGMLSIQGAARTVLSASRVEENTAEYAVLINGGPVELEDLNTEQGARAHVRLEHTKGTVRGCSFTSKAGSGAGNGMELSASFIGLFDSRFNGHRGVGLSSTAASQVLVHASTFTACGTAVSTLDGSIVNVADNTFTGNTTVLNAAKDKAETGGRLVLYPNTLTGNERERTIDASSTVTTKDSIDMGTLKSFGHVDVERKPERPRRRRAGGSN